MREPTISLTCLLAAVLLLATPTAHTAPADGNFSPDRVLVTFIPGAAASERRSAHSQAGATLVRSVPQIDLEIVAVPAGTVEAAIGRYQQNPNVLSAEPNFIRPLFLPVTTEGSEPTLGIENNYTEQWSLHNTGQGFGATSDSLGLITAPAYDGIVDSDIDAPEGWSISHGSAGISIAVLDSGVSCSHVDLDSKCLEQVNFVDEHGSPLDDLLGHGTHVAGIAAAETDNGVGIAGVAREATFGSLKVCYEDSSLAIFGILQGLCEDEDIIDAIIYATDAGYQVINMSLAGPQMSTAFENAVNYAWNGDVVVIAGAGNAYTPDRLYPAAYTNVIAVGATDYYDNLAFFSTFSTPDDGWVSVLAPGHVIFSTMPGEMCGIAPDDPEGCYDWKSGTSMATPIVAGVAALLRGYNPGATNTDIRAALEQAADKTGSLGQDFTAWSQHGRVNLHGALSYNGDTPGDDPGTGGDTTAPVISNVTSTQLNGPSFWITWTTDEPATSKVVFTCCGEIGDTALVTDHSVTFKGKKHQLYTYEVHSADAAGNLAVSGPYQHQN